MMAEPRLLIEKRIALLSEAYKAQSRFVEKFCFVLEADGYDMGGSFRFRDFLGHEILDVQNDLAELPRTTDRVECPPLTSEQMRARLVHIRSVEDAA